MQQALRITNLQVPDLHRFNPPSIEEVFAYGDEIGLPRNESEKMFHYYMSNGWKVGRVTMKSWHSAMAGWKIRWRERQSSESALSPNMRLIQLRAEMTRVKEDLRKYPVLADTRWLDSKEDWERKVKAWREPREKLKARKAELLKLMEVLK